MQLVSKRYLMIFSLVPILFTLSSCGGGGGDNTPPSPTVTTTPATGIGTDNAALNGTVNPNAQATNAWLEWGTDSTLVSSTATDNQAIGAGTTAQSVSATIAGLTSGTKYYYRVAATNASGTQKGAIASFTTAVPNSPPTVTTSAADNVTTTGATLHGTVSPNELATTGWFEWGTDNNLASFTSTPSQSLGSGKTSVAITATPALSPGTTYYFRVAASNSVGTSKGSILTFNTLPQLPLVTTQAANAIMANSATLNANVNPNGLATTAFFEYGTDPLLSNITTTGSQAMGSGTTGQPISVTLSLSAATTYYFRVIATNSAGTSKGEIISFTTPLISKPTVTTNPATFNSATSGVLKGDVNPNGFATIAWFEYATNPTFSPFSTTSSQSMGTGASVLPFNATISLSAYTTYYFRAAASNGGGTQRGAIRSFQTGVRYVAVGDSITEGSDGSNLTGGYEPILGNLLMNNPYTVANEGVGGTTSGNGADSIAATLSNYPSAQYYLIMYGTNDSSTTRGTGYPFPKETYKTNMQAIITAIKNAGKIPYIAKVPYVDSSNPDFPAGENFSDLSIQQYNQAVDELVSENIIPVTPPAFYVWFQSHTSQLADGIHPNSAGYQSMATLWSNALP